MSTSSSHISWGQLRWTGFPPALGGSEAAFIRSVFDKCCMCEMHQDFSFHFCSCIFDAQRWNSPSRLLPNTSCLWICPVLEEIYRTNSGVTALRTDTNFNSTLSILKSDPEWWLHDDPTRFMMMDRHCGTIQSNPLVPRSRCSIGHTGSTKCAQSWRNQYTVTQCGSY